ncbi:unnamed protein product [Brachionus calyciflorus]|uniref:G-protein coupled receptors family 1 profile domain-containing protein n=1 Tax=Brachionus calyciflorus TaxID=104777 RepID=A0A814N998_9BILA|nr:unnamed protein product [Brachionus calyciflorus]
MKSFAECNGSLTCEVEVIIFSIIGVLALTLTIFGSFSNAFSAYVCRSATLKDNSTFIILFFVFLFKITSLYTWNLDVFLSILPLNKAEFHGKYEIDQQNIIESTSIPTCKIFTFNQFFSLHSISWLLTFMAIDQVIKIYFPNNRFQSIKKTYLICFFIILTLFLLNSHILLFGGVIKKLKVNTSEEINGTFVNRSFQIDKINCYESDLYSFYPIWDQIHLFVFCFVPFLIMIICNILMKIKLVPTKNLKISNKSIIKKKKIAKFIILYSIFFMNDKELSSLFQTSLAVRQMDIMLPNLFSFDELIKQFEEQEYGIKFTNGKKSKI